MSDDECLKFLALKYGKEDFLADESNIPCITFSLMAKDFIDYNLTTWCISEKGWKYLETI